MDTKVAGIDYSMTSPAICVHEGKNWSIDNCVFYYLVKKPKLILKTKQLKGFLYKDFKTQQERFNNLSIWSINILNDHGIKNVGLEGYSYGSSSNRLFEIGENTGLLKQKMWSNEILFEVYAPPSVKKFGCGKGNAGKDVMWESFKKETNLNLFHIFGLDEGKNTNPINDIVDAYYICKMKHFS